MKNFKIIPLLADLSNSEAKRCEKFLLQYYTADSQVISLMKNIREHVSSIPISEISSTLHQSHYSHLSGPAYNKLLSKLFVTTEQWLVADYISNDNYIRDLMLHRAYNERGLFKHATYQANKIKRNIDAEEKKSLKKQHAAYQILHQEYYSDHPAKYTSQTDLFKDLMISHLAYTKSILLQYLCEAENWGRIKNNDYSYEKHIIQSMISLLPESPEAKALEQLHQLLSHQDLEMFYDLKNRLFSGAFAESEELHTLTSIYLINICLMMRRKGVIQDPNEHVDLIEYGLKTKTLYSSGKIPLTRFYNLITTIGQLKGYDWADNFIHRWIDQVETKSKDGSLKLAKAINSFNCKRYHEIRPLLLGKEFESQFEKNRALSLELIGIYSERNGQYDVLRNFISNYKRMLKRNKEKMSYNAYKSFYNLIKVVELLVQRDFRKVTIHIDKYDHLAFRTWCKEMVGSK